MEFQLVKKINASADTNAHPTIPFVGPGGTTTPTPTPSQPVGGPTIELETEKTSLDVGEESTIEITIDSKSQEVEEFKIVISYDSSHLQIIDSVELQSGTQIEYIDSHFVSFENVVDTDISGEGGTTGNITITAQAQNDQAASISGRTIARIHFTVISAKTSKLSIIKTESTLLNNSVNILDADTLQDLELSSEGITTPTITPTPIPTVTKVPNTALTSNSVTLILVGVVLLVSGFVMKRQIDSKISKERH